MPTATLGLGLLLVTVQPISTSGSVAESMNSSPLPPFSTPLALVLVTSQVLQPAGVKFGANAVVGVAVGADTGRGGL